MEVRGGRRGEDGAAEGGNKTKTKKEEKIKMISITVIKKKINVTGKEEKGGS